MITIQGISKSFNGQSNVLNNVSFELKQGEFLALVGSSGSGKTTLIKLLNQLITPDAGTIFYKKSDIRQLNPIELRRQFGNVFQQASLFPYLTVGENVRLPLKICGVDNKQQFKRSEEILEFVKLNPTYYRDRMPDELSGGEQQRVNLARALVHDPDVLFMDEPLSALDAVTRQELQQDLLKLHQQLKKTILFITHDLNEAMLLAQRIAVLHHGHLEQIDERDTLLASPKTLFVKELLAKGFHCV